MIAGSIAANGTPSAVARQIAPPPYEKPNAPIRCPLTPGCAASQPKSSRTSWISRGPSIETSPSDCPCPRASNVSAA